MDFVHRNYLFRSLAICFVIVFYLWVVTAGTWKFNVPGPTSMYNLLAEGFLHKQLSLPIVPSEDLLKLSDPYDSGRNFSFKLHDASLYDRKYYLYFGPTPVLVFYIPYKLLFKKSPTDTLALFVFTTLIFFISVAILFYLQGKYFKTVPEWTVILSVLLLGLCNFSPMLLRRAAVYEIAIASGMFFLLLSLYFFLRTLEYDRYTYLNLCLGSICIGLAIGGRPFAIFSSIVPFLLFCKFSLRKNPFFDKIGFFTVTFFPLVVFIFLTFLYNYLRFDDPFEFGGSYQLPNYNVRIAQFFNFWNIIPQTYRLLFMPLIIDFNFPFFHLSFVNNIGKLQTGVNYSLGIVAGLIPCVPVTLINLLFVFCLLKKTKEIKFPYFEFFIIILPAIFNFFVIAFSTVNEMRYRADLATPILVCTGILWFYFNSILKRYKLYVFRIVFLILFFYSVMVNIALSINNNDISLNSQNPDLYRKIESVFTIKR